MLVQFAIRFVSLVESVMDADTSGWILSLVFCSFLAVSKKVALQ